MVMLCQMKVTRPYRELNGLERNALPSLELFLCVHWPRWWWKHCRHFEQFGRWLTVWFGAVLLGLSLSCRLSLRPSCAAWLIGGAALINHHNAWSWVIVSGREWSQNRDSWGQVVIIWLEFCRNKIFLMLFLQVWCYSRSIRVMVHSQ